MTPAQIARLLALPLEARQRLAEQPGPGCWCRYDPFNGDPESFHVQESAGDIYRGSAALGAEEMIARGWAWAPCCALAWLGAATPEGRAWFGSGPGGVWAIYHADASTVAMSADPITCALAALEATYGK